MVSCNFFAYKMVFEDRIYIVEAKDSEEAFRAANEKFEPLPLGFWAKSKTEENTYHFVNIRRSYNFIAD
jgi:hypothetical protein